MPADDWATYFATFATDLAADRDLDRTADLIVSRVHEVVPDATHAALTLRSRRGFTTLAATSPVAREAERLQVSRGSGPAVDPSSHAEFVRSGDLPRESRWPGWSKAVAERGLRSVLCFRLAAEDGPIGALTLYADEPGRFAAAVVPLGLVYATHAGHAVASAHLVTGLHTALESRHTIGLAQGILMREYDIDVESAFALLTRYSSRLNVKLRTLAEQVVEDRRLPDDASDQAEAPIA